MTVKTLGDFIEEDKRGTKGLQREGVDNPEVRNRISTIFYPSKDSDANTLTQGSADINSGDLSEFEQFYKIGSLLEIKSFS